jgi:parallel beta-helix repeat protein
MVGSRFIFTIYILLILISGIGGNYADSSPHTCMVLVTSTSGGAVHPDGAVPVLYNSQVILTITPYPGYHISGVFVDGKTFKPAHTVRISPVLHDMAVHIEFSKGEGPASLSPTLLPSISPSSDNTSTPVPVLQHDEHVQDLTGNDDKSFRKIIVGMEDADYIRIQDAISNASPGDTIIIKPGIYREQIIIPKSLSLIGDPMGMSRPVIFGASGTIVIVGADNVTLQNLSLIGGGHVSTELSAAVSLAGFSDFLISHCMVSEAGYGITLNETHNTTIVDCTIRNVTDSGLLLSNLQQITLERNIIDYCKVGISGRYLDAMRMKENLVSRNEEYGVQIIGITNSEIVDNIVSLNAPSYFTAHEHDVGGLSLSRANNVSLSGNQLNANGGTALIFDEAILMQMDNNIFTGNYAGFTYSGNIPDPQSRIDPSNLIDGLPVIYCEGVMNETISGAALATLYLHSCSDIIVDRITTTSRNGYGIMVKGGHNISILHCQVGENLHQNILLASVDCALVNDSVMFNGSRYGIGLIDTRNVTLSDNRIWNHPIGIGIRESGTNTLISRNTFSNNGIGFQMDNVRSVSGFGTFEDNNISGGRVGLLSQSSGRGTVIGNTILGTMGGINLTGSYDLRIEENHIESVDYGIYLTRGSGSEAAPDRPCFGNGITFNTISAGRNPVAMNDSREWVYGNGFMLNDFITTQTGGTATGPDAICDTSITFGGVYSADKEVADKQLNDSVAGNLWDTGIPYRYRYVNNSYTGMLGNYWSPYMGREIASTGIGDQPYIVNGDNKDQYPLIASHVRYETAAGGYLLNLQAGWNFVSTPSVLLSGKDSATIFSGVDTDGHSMYTYKNDTWVLVASSDRIQPLIGYWIYATEKTQVPLALDPGTIPSPFSLKSGWNAIGFPAIQPSSASDALSSLDVAWSYVVPFNSSSQYYDDPIMREDGGSGFMYPSQGYWVYMNQEWILQPVTG